jgi:hypothetical protein
MDKEKKWKKFLELGEFYFETDGKIIRAIDKNGIILIETNKSNVNKEDIINNYNK